MKNLLYSIILLLISGTYGFVSGQSQIKGIVIDKATQKGVISASVYIPELKMGVSSKIDGAFEFNSIPTGTYTIQISSIGYNKLLKKIVINESDTILNLKIEL